MAAKQDFQPQLFEVSKQITGWGYVRIKIHLKSIDHIPASQIKVGDLIKYGDGCPAWRVDNLSREGNRILMNVSGREESKLNVHEGEMYYLMKVVKKEQFGVDFE